MIEKALDICIDGSWSIYDYNTEYATFSDVVVSVPYYRNNLLDEIYDSHAHNIDQNMFYEKFAWKNWL